MESKPTSISKKSKSDTDNNSKDGSLYQDHALWKKMGKSNGFKLKGILGQGSFGTVMKAECRATKNMYAIKLINDPFKSLYNAR
jgi:serine/threonine protein kinase